MWSHQHFCKEWLKPLVAPHIFGRNIRSYISKIWTIINFTKTIKRVMCTNLAKTCLLNIINVDSLWTRMSSIVFHTVHYSVENPMWSAVEYYRWSVGVTYYNDVIMSAIASQITSLSIVYSTVYSGADQRKHQSSASLTFVREIHWWPVTSPHIWPVTRKMFPFDDVIMFYEPWNKDSYLMNVPSVYHIMLLRQRRQAN